MIATIILFVIFVLIALLATIFAHDDSWERRYSKRVNIAANFVPIVFLMLVMTIISRFIGIDGGMEKEARSILIYGKSHYKVVETPGIKDVVRKQSKIVEED